MQLKRTLITALAMVLALSGLGTFAVQAQEGGEPAWLGVGIADTDDGVLVSELAEDSPAADAGIEVGDLIVSLDDTPVESARQLVEVVQSYSAGDTVTVTVLRGDEEIAFDVILGERPPASDRPGFEFEFGPGMMQGRLNLLGIELDMTGDGLLVERIEEESPLADAGLAEGDLITAINGEAVNEMQPRELMLALRGEEEVTLTVLRDDEEIAVTLDLAELLDGVIAAMPVNPIAPGLLGAQPPTQLGVSYSMLNEDMIAELELDIDVTEGAWISEIFEGTPAEEAGLQEGDVITAVDGDVLDEERTLGDRLYAYEEGDVVTLTVLRDGEEIEIEVELGPRGRNFRGRGGPMMPHGHMGERMPGFGQRFERGPGRGPGHGRGHGPGHGRGFGQGFGPGFFFDEEFFENHPFMQDWFEMMPDGEFHFRFGPTEIVPLPDGDSDTESVPESDSMPGTNA